MKCNGCGNPEAFRTRTRCIEGEMVEICDKCGRLGGSHTEKKTGFMFGNKLLAKNSNKALAKQVRQEYLGTDHDEHRGRDY